MRYRILFFASFLPTTIFAQSSALFPSGAAHHSGLPIGGTSTGFNATYPIFSGNATANASSISVKHQQPSAPSTELPPKQPTNITGIYTVSFKTSRHVSATGGYIQVSRTKVSDGSKPTYTSVNASTSVVSSTGRLPISKSAHFVNSASGIKTHAGTRIHSHSSNIGASSRQAKPTASGSYTRTRSNTTSTSRHSPFTKTHGFHFANSTSGVAGPTGLGFVHSSGTGVSPGFAKPTIGGDYTHLPSDSSSIPSTSAHLPFTKSNGFHFANATSSVAQPTGSRFFHPSGTRASSGFFKPTAGSNYTHVPSSSSVSSSNSGHLPFTKSNGFHFANSTSSGVVQPAGAGSIEYSGTGAYSQLSKPTNTAKYTQQPSNVTQAPSTSGHMPYTKPSSPLVQNSTAVSPALSTGLFSTRSTGVLSTGAFPTATGHPDYTKPTSALNSTATAAPSSRVPTTLVTKVSLARSIAPTRLTVSISVNASPSAVVFPEYYQCGGLNFVGEGSCVKGTVCKKWNLYYHQCVDERYA